MDSHPFDRHSIRFRPLSERKNKVNIERDHVHPDAPVGTLTDTAKAIVRETADKIQQARHTGAARMLTFGAHTIKNGLSPILIRLIEEGWITHLATNGAGIIHDWEFAFQGESSEDVARYLATGEFGAWEETGRYLNLAINIGAFDGLGYGAAIGRMIEAEELVLPTQETLRTAIEGEDRPRAAAAIDLLDKMKSFDLNPGSLPLPHPFKQFSIQAAAHRLAVPFTSHPMIGHDIIYEHPMSSGAAIGRTAERDFLSFVNSVSNLDGGVYLSVGSAIMSPMVFEKALSMTRNVANSDGTSIDDLFITVVDLAQSNWDWSQGEPPEDDPAYYMRFNKSFSRAGGTLRYAACDNRNFLLALSQALSQAE